MVLRRVENEDFIEEDDVDPLDKIDDKYGLFEEENIEERPASKEESKEIYKQERQKRANGKKSAANLMSSWGGALSIYRILSYMILFIVIVTFIKKDIFEPIAFLVGLAVVPVSSLFLVFVLKD